MFKTLVALVDGTMTVGIVPVTSSLDLKALAAAAGGKKATMADVADAERATGYVAGGISPLGQRKRLPTRCFDAFRPAASRPCTAAAGAGAGDRARARATWSPLTGATVADIAAGGWRTPGQ